MELNVNSKNSSQNPKNSPKADLEPLMTFQCHATADMRATCMDFNRQNEDLLAVGYSRERINLQSPISSEESRGGPAVTSNGDNLYKRGITQHGLASGALSGSSGRVGVSGTIGSMRYEGRGVSKENSNPNGGGSFKGRKFIDYMESGSEGKSDSSKGGLICFWTVKNANFPERMIRTHAGVTALRFCNMNPYLLGVGLEDGTVAIYDLRKTKNDQYKFIFFILINF